MRKLAAVAFGAAAVLALGACAGEGAGGGGVEGGETLAPEDVLVGVSMPTQTSERWIADGEAVEAGLEELGYDVDLQFANDDIPTQSQQIDQMITNGADVLIIAAIDGTALGSQLDAAAAAGIPVISYDRLIRDNENVDFYVTFDNYDVGVQQATSLLQGLGILDADRNETGEEGPFNIELFAGSLDDNNTRYFFQGAMDQLNPFIEEGKLVVLSGQTEMEQVATERWDGALAQARMDDLLSTHYGSAKVDAVLAPYDGISRGIIASLEGAGYELEELPVITGQDAEGESIQYIVDGRQSATVFKDTRLLADTTVDIALAVANGDKPEVNDEETYDNGVKVVPAMLLEPVSVDIDNYQEVVVDSGYIDAADLG